MRTTNRPVTTAALALSIFMAALEATVVSTAMPTVISDLGGIQRYAWVFTAYMVASTVTVPVYGKLADLYGRKPVMLFGIALFLVGSIASGLSPSMDALIAFRLLQGLGAGSMQPIALTIIGDLYDLKERARIQGVFGAVWGIAGFIGPLSGGLIVKHLSWHWVFFINVPFGALAALLLISQFHEQVQRKESAGSFDVLGSITLTAGVVLLLLGVQMHENRWLPLTLAALVLAAFISIERSARQPLFPLRMFTVRSIAISSAAGALFSASMFGATTYVPLFVQGVLGGTPTAAGGMITPMIVAWPVCSTVAGWLLARVGFRPLIVGGLFLAAAANLGMALFLHSGAQLVVAQVAMGFFGAGLGFAASALLIAVQTSVGWDMRGVATASNMFFRTIGGSLGIGLMGSVLVSRLTQDPSIPMSAANALLGPERGRSLDPETLRVLSGALEGGLRINFWLMFAFAACAFLTGLFFPKIGRAEKASGPGAAVAEPVIPH